MASIDQTAIHEREAVYPRAVYSKRADYLAVLFEPGEYIAERVDATLTVHRAPMSSRVVGFTIKGIRLVARQMQELQLMEPDDDVDIQTIMLTVTSMTRKPSREYREVMSTPGRILRQSIDAALADVC